MSFLTRYRERRLDVRHPGIVTNATAVVAAALPYGSGACDTGIWRHVSAFARGRDYHETVRNRLDPIAREIKRRFPESDSRIFVDSSPVMERTWALSAGIGHLGKHGQIIVPSRGSRFVLGEIICSSTPTPPAIEPPVPFSLCSGCSLCVDACPTGSITAPPMIDGARCLSYWTIENRDEVIPAEIAEKMTLVFGCDVCTAVCPHDKPGMPHSLESTPFSCAPHFGLDDILLADDAVLSRIISGTALERSGPKVIRRNAKIVMENQKRKLIKCANQL